MFLVPTTTLGTITTTTKLVREANIFKKQSWGIDLLKSTHLSLKQSRLGESIPLRLAHLFAVFLVLQTLYIQTSYPREGHKY